jgi:hypothetical protein
MTFMSVVVSVVSTFAGLFLIWLFWRLSGWALGRWRQRQPGWWRVDGKMWARRIVICGKRESGADQTSRTQPAAEEERRPLLV